MFSKIYDYKKERLKGKKSETNTEWLDKMINELMN